MSKSVFLFLSHIEKYPQKFYAKKKLKNIKHRVPLNTHLAENIGLAVACILQSIVLCLRGLRNV